MRNARAQKLQWSDPTVHSSTVFGSRKKSQCNVFRCFFIKFTKYNRKCCLRYDNLNIYPGFLSCPQPDGLSRLYDSCLDNFLYIHFFTRNVGSCMKAKKLFKRLVDSFLILTSIKSFGTLQTNHRISHQVSPTTEFLTRSFKQPFIPSNSFLIFVLNIKNGS